MTKWNNKSLEELFLLIRNASGPNAYAAGEEIEARIIKAEKRLKSAEGIIRGVSLLRAPDNGRIFPTVSLCDEADHWLAGTEGERKPNRVEELARAIAELSRHIETLQDYHGLDPFLLALWLEFHPEEGEKKSS